MSTVAESLREIRDRIDAAARRAGRDPAEVTLIGASKTVPAERIAEALDAGLADLGENRAQELLAKAPVARRARRPAAVALRRPAPAEQGGRARPVGGVLALGRPAGAR